MAFRKKAKFILTEQPDILVVPECENPDKLIFENDLNKPTDLFWFGQNPNKGLGVFSYSHRNPKSTTVIQSKYGTQYLFTVNCWTMRILFLLEILIVVQFGTSRTGFLIIQTLLIF